MEYGPREPSHVVGYLGAMSAFATGVAGLALIGRARGLALPDRYPVSDLVLGGLATHKFARLVAKEAVTTPIRMPFTRFKENAGSAEVNEEPRDVHPAVHTIGELLTCPFCLAPWIGAAYVAGLTLAPGLARTWAAVFSVVGISDSMQHVYAQLRTD
jgi:hypothetical protein